MTFKLAEGRASNPNQKRGSLTVVLDGYNAPVSAGNFVDLVQRKFYDGMEVQRSDGFVVQSVRNPLHLPMSLMLPALVLLQTAIIACADAHRRRAFAGRPDGP